MAKSITMAAPVQPAAAAPVVQQTTGLPRGFSLPEAPVKAAKATGERARLKAGLRAALAPYLGEGPTPAQLGTVTLQPVQSGTGTLGFSGCGQVPYTMPDGSGRVLQTNIQAWVTDTKGTILEGVEAHRKALAAYEASVKGKAS